MACFLPPPPPFLPGTDGQAPSTSPKTSRKTLHAEVHKQASMRPKINDFYSCSREEGNMEYFKPFTLGLGSS